tara:strand:- start:184 stop:1014 length:831 start_codon:yes stop_codon:yes gene_type:complete
MSYTQNIINQAECNYINPMSQNAEVFLKPCINHNVVPDYTLRDPGDLCTGQPTVSGNYHYFYNGYDELKTPEEKSNYANTFNSKMKNENISRNQNLIDRQKRLVNYLNTSNPNVQQSYEDYVENINDVDARTDIVKTNVQDKIYESKPVFPMYIPPTLLKKETEEPPKEKSGDLIEGFTPGDFLSNNGPGEQYIKTCPIQYRYCEKSGMCKKKTTDGPVETDTSDYTDICYPYNYDGIDNFGRIMCSSTKNINGYEVKISTDINNLNSKEQLFGHY